MNVEGLSRRSSPRAIRRYVQAELAAVADEWRELYVTYRQENEMGLPVSSRLWWTIRSTRPDPSGLLLNPHYLLEARRRDGEFVIWFGALGGFIWESADPRPRMFPSVHVPFPSEQKVLDLPMPTRRVPAEPCSLGSVLGLMLRRRAEAFSDWDPDGRYDHSDGFDRVAYPMNCWRY
jgi:hypothetical protein